MSLDEENSPSFHRLLDRQLRKTRKSDGSVDVEALLKMVNVAYGELEHNSRTMERAMQLMSEEMRAHHETIRQEKIKAESANEAKTEFVSTVSHELRTPMHSIINYTVMGLKQEAVQQSDKLTKYLTNINIASKRMLDLLDNLLDISKIESGNVDFEIASGDLREIVTHAIEAFDSMLKARNITLHVEHVGSHFFVMCDHKKILTVLHHMFANALRASKDFSVIRVTLQPSEDEKSLVCHVVDQGVGFPEEDLSRAFEKFYRNPRMHKDVSGTGLGMSLCKEIILGHRGEIAAHSLAEEGAKITFTLPLAN